MVELDSRFFPPYYALIEREDGSTYIQAYREIEDLEKLYNSLGEGYKICCIF